MESEIKALRAFNDCGTTLGFFPAVERLADVLESETRNGNLSTECAAVIASHVLTALNEVEFG